MSVGRWCAKAQSITHHAAKSCYGVNVDRGDGLVENGGCTMARATAIVNGTCLAICLLNEKAFRWSPLTWSLDRVGLGP